MIKCQKYREEGPTSFRKCAEGKAGDQGETYLEFSSRKKELFSSNRKSDKQSPSNPKDRGNMVVKTSGSLEFCRFDGPQRRKAASKTRKVVSNISKFNDTTNEKPE